MKKTLLTATVAMLVLGAAQSAFAGESVLERVLGSISEGNMKPVNGVYSNIAENIAVLNDGEILNKIDGSITNVMNEASGPNAAVDSTVNAVTGVTASFGNLSTTVLGAVNTGDITLGLNQDMNEAISGSTSAVKAKLEAVGTATDTSALVMNVASNATDVIGSVSNTMTGVNASYGNIGTTVLGAVNTGTITNGVNAAVSGVKSTVVGQ